jgi:anaerobic magnesium-protoporphyrin IX monomethyl ester cyclase
LMERAGRAGLKVHGCFVLGLPGETEETMAQTVDFALGLGLHTAQFSAAVPFPGTRYFDWCVENRLLRSRNWSDWLADGEQAAVIDYPGLGREKVQAAVDRALQRFYFRPGYMVRFLAETDSKSDLYRKLRGMGNFLSYLWRRR